MLGAEFRLPSVAYEDPTPNKKTPIRVKFEIPYFTVSGIQVCIFTSGGNIGGPNRLSNRSKHTVKMGHVIGLTH
ncbi:putative AP-2 complex subunit mu superfamily protein [Helianthus annuus]|nr:putative AP-2 complex subunit mu superfamily protein [Helianthus annuus]KAJ0776267.1 putative AP-2 complex subunit mu superfamily protein [Helianthus annuus]